MWESIKQKFASLTGRIPRPSLSAKDSGDSGGLSKIFFTIVGFLLILILIIGLYWSREPAAFSVSQNAQSRLRMTGSEYVVGSTTTATMIRTAETLLDKPGGYLSNDVFPPGLYLDNIPNWEFGVLVQLRDLSRAYRESFSRSQSQSTEDPDLIIAEPRLHFDNNSWLFPPTEGQYREAIERLESYLTRIADQENVDAQFYARADNLSSWLLDVESRLGSLSQRLSASVRAQRVNTDTAGELSAAQSTPVRQEVSVKTPWLQIDDIFYEARGATWALMHFLKAVEVDFQGVLEDKNAQASLSQIIRELEASQRSIFFPVILNGSGFGIFANHSLAMANYISRANAAIIDLRSLLSQG
ncbi:MAG: DUF2333 family protein [Gammaproteobacteria bacterium]|jgi:hypothetical protein|nr:DUF2333 family protein [Gammaproteobacteria bacterium]MBT3859786.1 DUF2333 family protein [Gammaproteobacteria bacterium]MBT3988819.1 DUF2333 family protein [Gammaproteobacteria bacterium]MBT4254427.1 DUF2333 family protein [Gammaproteobacteria bacterium]MBT4580918.1 DUF2333 family protein [Gammaproteobacteria bacterium]